MTSQTQLTHISTLPCWICKHLVKDPYSQNPKRYRCIQNKRIDEYEPANFAEACPNYDEKVKR